MEPKNRLAEIFNDIGFIMRPTDETLAAWNMTLHRFNLLANNKSRTPMSIQEMNDLKKWLQTHFKGKNAYLFESDMPSEFRTRQHKLPLNA